MHRAAESADLVLDKPLAVRVGGREILLVRTAEGLFALEDLCPHAQQPLSTGKATGSLLTCKHHGVRIDLGTGRVVESMGFLGLQPVERFELREEAGAIWIELPEEAH